MNEASLIEYQIKFELINTTQVVRSDCNAISINNTGTVAAIVNGLTLNSGDELNISGNEMEIDRTTYNVYFDPAAVGTREVYVLRKQYK